MNLNVCMGNILILDNLVISTLNILCLNVNYLIPKIDESRVFLSFSNSL